VLNIRSIWLHSEARLHLNKTLQRPEDTYRSLGRRGVKRVKVLSIKKSLRRLLHSVPMLTYVDLSGCYNLTENVMEIAIQRELPNLNSLDLGLCKDVGDGTLGRIGTYCNNLRHLSLEGNTKITNAGLLLLAWGAKELVSLNLKSCRNITDHGINVMAVNADGSPLGSKLEFLGLQDCKLTDKSLAYISRGMPQLKRINLSTISGITDTGLKYLAEMPGLEEVNLRNCDNVTDLGLAYLSDDTKRPSTLRVLDLSFCSSVTDAGLAHVAKGLKSLEKLSISSCLVGDTGLLSLGRGLTRLRTLDLGQCNNISEDGLAQMAAKAKSLRSVDVYGCKNVSERVASKLPEAVRTNRTLC
jgi:F-box/leucine-rich repeat protein 14